MEWSRDLYPLTFRKNRGGPSHRSAFRDVHIAHDLEPRHERTGYLGRKAQLLLAQAVDAVRTINSFSHDAG
jgi:hypothetical protein